MFEAFLIMKFTIPEFPEKHRIKLIGPGRMVDLSTSKDLESSLASLQRSPELDHKALGHYIDRTQHRTLAVKKWNGGQRTYYADGECTMSSDNLHESYLRETLFSDDHEDSSQTSDDDPDDIHPEPPSYKVMFETDVVPEPESPLCDRCQMINIDNLTEEGEGYKHSTWSELKSSARFCTLCSRLWCGLQDELGFFHHASDDVDGLEIRLLLDVRGGGSIVLPDQSHTSELPWKCIHIRIIDRGIGKGQTESDGTAMQDFESGQRPVSLQHQQDDICIRDVCMMCYTEEADPSEDAGVPWLRNIVENTDSSDSLNIAKGWLKQCLAAERSAKDHHDNHDHNLQSLGIVPAESPKRLLQITPSKDPNDSSGQSVRLIETRGRHYKYLALSYCWGKVSDTGTAWMTKSDTLHQHMEDTDWRNFPATIRDFLWVATALDVQYVWIDSLCTIQDDISDWEIESAKMGGIYRGALLTVAASRAHGSSVGLFNQDRAPHNFNHPSTFSKYVCVESCLRNGRISRLYLDHPGERSAEEQQYAIEVYDSPLAGRAWALQEQVLSRRTLYFGESQLYWECGHCRLSQNNAPHAHPIHGEYQLSNLCKPLNMRQVLIYWYHNVVEGYTRRGLTDPDDRLVAMSAIARATYLNRQVEYAAGLWRDCILPGLCWYRWGRGRKNVTTTARCPSWSWASQMSAVRYREALHQDEEGTESHRNVPKVLDVQISASENNPFGHVHSGRIMLHTRVTTGTVTRHRFRSDTSCLSSLHDMQTLVISEKNGWRVWFADAVMDDEGRMHQRVTVALVNYWNTDWDAEKQRWLLLLLEETGDQEQSYRRVGLAIVEGIPDPATGQHQEGYFDPGWTERVITLV